jgi:hypothetical protein
MKLFVDFAEMLVGDVRVYLSRCDAAVSEHALNASDIGTVHKKICCKTMTHRVGAYMLGDSCESGVFTYHSLNAAG